MSTSVGDLQALAYLASDFLGKALRELWRDDRAPVRVELGAEHIQQLQFAQNSLKALLEVVQHPRVRNQNGVEEHGL